MPERTGTLRRDTLLLTGVGVVSQIMGFAYRVLLSRLVGAETLGLYQLVMPAYSVLLSMTVSGLAVGVSTLSARYYVSGGIRATGQLLRVALGSFFALWAVCAAAVALGGRWIAGVVLGDERTHTALLLLLAVLALTGVENLTKHHFYGIGETRLPAAVELAEQFVRTVVILLLLIALLPLSQENTVALMVLGMLVSEIFSVVVLTMLRHAREGALQWVSRSGVKRRFQKALYTVAFPVGFAAVLNHCLGSANALLLPRQLRLSGLEAVTAMELYGVVFGMTLPLLTLCYAFVNALCLTLLPALTRCMALRQVERFNYTACHALQATSIVTFPMLALTVPLGDEVGELLFQDRRVGEYLLPLAVAVALSVQEGVLATVLNGAGRQAQSAAVSFLCGGIQLAFTYWTGSFGLTAFVTGMMINSAVGLLVRLFVAHRATGLRVSVVRWMMIPTVAAVTSGLWVNLLHRAIKPFVESLEMLAFCSLVGLGLYWAISVLLSAVLCKEEHHC